MNLQARVEGFANLGEYLSTSVHQDSAEELFSAEVLNPWFTKENIDNCLDYWSKQLEVGMLKSWLNPYKIKEPVSPKKVLLIMAGNIPLVGFHDFLQYLSQVIK